MEKTLSPTEELRLACEQFVAAGTSVGTAGSKLLDYFKGLMPSISNAFSGSNALEKLPKYQGLGRDHRKFLERVNLHSYGSLREFKAFAPAGLNTTYLNYLGLLSQAVDHVLQFQPKTINPYLIFLAQLTSSRNAALSTDSHEAENKALQATRAEFDKQFATMFRTNVHETVTKVGNVIERNADWPEVFQKSLELATKIEGLKLTTIQHGVKQAEDYLDIIFHLAQTGKLESATPEVLNAIAEGAYQVASELEFLSVIYYRCLTVNQAIKDTMDGMMKALD